MNFSKLLLALVFLGLTSCAATSSRLTYHIEDKYDDWPAMKAEIDKFVASEAFKDDKLRWLSVSDLLWANSAYKKPLETRFRAIRYLLENGVEVGLPNPDNDLNVIKETFLIRIAAACKVGFYLMPANERIAFARLFLDYDEDPNRVVEKGLTYVDLAAGGGAYYQMERKNHTTCEGDPAVYGELIARGGDPNRKNPMGVTPKEIFEAINIQRRHDQYKKVDDGGGGDFLTKAFVVAVGAGMAAGSSMSAEQKANFIAAYTADVVNDTGGTNLQKMKRTAEMDNLVAAKVYQDNSSLDSKARREAAEKSVPGVSCYGYDTSNVDNPPNRPTRRPVGFEGFRYKVVKFRPVFCIFDEYNKGWTISKKGVSINQYFNQNQCSGYNQFTTLANADTSNTVHLTGVGDCYYDETLAQAKIDEIKSKSTAAASKNKTGTQQ
jgi:hypothetical protein